MVTTFNSILNKFSNNEALLNSEIEYLNELSIKYPYFKLCEYILFANKNKIEILKKTENQISEATDYKENTISNKDVLSQIEQKEIILKFINNPINFYDLLK